ncbi:GNAT family N-acetyltransferase [Clostridium sp. LIBA-8841]|uniref:GNAT family N-acetyltransferase n=1 Tax=Clostridium sp. LIBA-8841 TaxID=2987530 RepID=UPI002AC4AD6A|nr:GNAT family N-acetyltransferase [Clostridium sp. LIBA-8841]MDZ5253891.1 GNAT family N-acetyltransferase [Clostridium sp. LIBA-8841]
MLDKSVEFFRMVLKREKGTKLKSASLPEGFKFVKFKKGDEKAWAEIETSVLEFENVNVAKEYFENKYIPYSSEIERRILFIENENGEKIATFTAWWRYTGERRHPFMEWVAVKPDYQGKGLGKALISEGVKLMVAIEGDCDMYIPTQTWSHKAIKLYRWAGFAFETEEKFPGGIENRTLEGIEVIKGLI